MCIKEVLFVYLDSWIIQSLKYQKKLQRFDGIVFLEMPSTHNIAIIEAGGFGMEKYFISSIKKNLRMW